MGQIKEGYDSSSSGVGHLDIELEKERDLERRNFHLRIEQMRREQDRMREEVEQLREKLHFANKEKELCEGQMPVENEMHRTDSPVLAREQELLLSFDQLASKVEEQDSQLAETKEDNIVLRSQIRSLREALEASREKGNHFRGIFGGRGISPRVEVDMWEDPADIRARSRGLQKELGEQKEVNKQLKAYVGEVLVNIMVKNPQMLEKK